MIAGSGEMSPRMAPIHRGVLQRLSAHGTVRAVALDTPYGFQENAQHLTERTVRYFRDRVRLEIEPVTLRRSGIPADDAAAADAVRQADFVFAGPGSPSYALRHWQSSGVAWALQEKLDVGGAVSVASAAAITIGAFALPVYEIYKAGEDPHWLEGIDVLSRAGLRVAVVPHFDNREGGEHDTRYCFMGERRLRDLEVQLPADAWILGVDENTALIIDVDDRIADVRGPGGVTVRWLGESRTLPAGHSYPLDELRPTRAQKSGRIAARTERDGRRGEAIRGPSESGDVRAFVRAVLELVEQATGHAAVSVDDRQALRSAVLRLGDLAARDHADEALARSLVDLLLAVRGRAREAGDWRTADRIREALDEAGVTVRDTGAGPVWERSTR